jgi:hypothetical protein
VADIGGLDVEDVAAVLGWPYQWRVRVWHMFCTGIDSVIGINGECSSGHSDWPSSWSVSTPDAWNSPWPPPFSAATVGDRGSGAEVICSKQAKNSFGESISYPSTSSPPLLQLSMSHNNADKASVASLSLRVDGIVSVSQEMEAGGRSWSNPGHTPNAAPSTKR